MVHKSSASSSYSHVRMRQTPDRSSDSSLTSCRQSSLCGFMVPSPQLLHQGLQFSSRVKCIVHRIVSLLRKILLLRRCQNRVKMLPGMNSSFSPPSPALNSSHLQCLEEYSRQRSCLANQRQAGLPSKAMGTNAVESHPELVRQ